MTVGLQATPGDPLSRLSVGTKMTAGRGWFATGGHLAHKLQYCISGQVGQSWIFLPSPSPNSSTAGTSAWLKPPPRRAGGLSPGAGLCVGKTLQESEGAGQRASEGRRLPAGGARGAVRAVPGLSQVPGRRGAPSPASLGRSGRLRPHPSALAN